MISHKAFRPLLLVLLSLLVNISSFAQEVISLNVDGVLYSVDLAKHTASLVKCTSLSSTDAVIPDSVALPTSI